MGGQPRHDLIPNAALHEVAVVLGFGGDKHSPWGWKNVADIRGTYTGKALRHLGSYLARGALDKESGRHHVAHAIADLFFVLENDIGPGPQRPTSGESPPPRALSLDDQMDNS